MSGHKSLLGYETVSTGKDLTRWLELLDFDAEAEIW
jgi:hypothetical protein